MRSSLLPIGGNEAGSQLLGMAQQVAGARIGALGIGVDLEDRLGIVAQLGQNGVKAVDEAGSCLFQSLAFAFFFAPPTALLRGLALPWQAWRFLPGRPRQLLLSAPQFLVLRF
jgi:hypothetical protein